MVKNLHLHGSQEVWDRVFKNLDLSYTEEPKNQGKLFEIVKIKFLEEIFPKAPAKIVEIGAVTGFVSLYFAKRGYEVTLLDTSKEILKIAEENFKKESAKGNFVVGDAEKLTFNEHEFDVVTSFGLLEHFENPEKSIKEMSRVLKKGGLFFADIVPSRFSVQTFGNFFNSVAVFLFWTLRAKPTKAVEKAKKNFKPDFYENSLSIAEYQRILEKAGISSVKVRGNRPFPRLTLPSIVDKTYTSVLKSLLPVWRKFDRWDSNVNKTWGAGWWFWGVKK